MARESVEQLYPVALSLFGGLKQAPAISDLFRGLKDFEQVLFDVADTPDSDGFLFQYGQVSWLSDPIFIVVFVRQLKPACDFDESEGYLQLNIEYQYALEEDLAQWVGHDWWFRGGRTSFGEWLDALMSNKIWETLKGRRLTYFQVWLDRL